MFLSIGWTHRVRRLVKNVLKRVQLHSITKFWGMVNHLSLPFLLYPIEWVGFPFQHFVTWYAFYFKYLDHQKMIQMKDNSMKRTL